MGLAMLLLFFLIGGMRVCLMCSDCRRVELVVLGVTAVWVAGVVA